MSLRSHPVEPTPDHPDPVTRNQIDFEQIQKNDPAGSGTNEIPRGNQYPISPNANAVPPSGGLIDQSTSGGNLKGELGDAKQGRDQGMTADELKIEKGADKDL